jgi:modification methylase
VAPGAELTDSRGRWTANVRADGTIAIGDHAASIHRLGAKVQGLDACNGWTFWHLRSSKGLQVIDELRQEIRDRMALVGA